MSDEFINATFTVSTDAFQQRNLAFGKVAVAEYHADTDTVTFDWPRIEQEAANEKSYIRGIAKILLAAREATLSGEALEYDCTDCGRHVIAVGFFGSAEAEKRCSSCQWIKDNVAPEHHGDVRERLGVPLAGQSGGA